MFRHVGTWFNNLIKNNTGLSSKNFYLVSVTLVCLLLLLVPAIVLIVEIIFNKTIQTDLTGLAEYIAAVAGVLTSVGITKAWSERTERSRKSKKPTEEIKETVK